MWLTVRSGPDAGATAEAAGELFVIGRDDACDLVLHDDNVSRRHASLSPLPDGRVLLTDLGSRNGTFVNGVRSDRPVVLVGDEELRLGDTVIALRRPAVTAVMPRGVVLTVESGEERGKQVEAVGEEFVIGRDELCRFVLRDPTVSARHASVEVLPDGRAVLTDLGSRNGTFVDGRQVYEAVRLEGGERIRLGDTIISTTAPARRETAVAAVGAWLTIDSGPEGGKAVKMTGDEFVVGRDETADLVLPDPMVSRRHAAFRIVGPGRAVVTDLGSANGTFVGGRRIAEAVELVGGESVQIGETQLRFGEGAVELPTISEQIQLVAATALPSARLHREPRLSTEALAGTCARRPWTTLSIWLLMFVLGLGVAGAKLEDTLTAEIVVGGNPESKRADRLIEERLRPKQLAELVVVRSPQLRVEEDAFRAEVLELRRRLLALGRDVVRGGRNFYGSGDPSLVSKDKHATILQFVLPGDFDTAEHNVGRLLEVVERADRSPRFEVLLSGQASTGHDFEAVAGEDLAKGESIGLAMAFIVLACVFGTLVASLLPVILAVISIGVALGLATVVGQAIDLAIFVTNMIVGMGLALGIDYALFVLTRYREERAAGREVVDAIVAAGATSSRAVLFSGLAVVLALFGMSLAPDPGLRSLGIGAMLVGSLSVLAALTLLPSLLALLGDRVNRIPVPILGRTRETTGSEQRFWARLAKAVMRRPVASLLVSTALLLAAAIPVLDLGTGSAGVSTLPDSTPSKRAFAVLARDFASAQANPAEIAIEGQVGTPAVRKAVERLVASMRRDPVFGPAETRVNRRGGFALVSAPVAGDPKGRQATDAVKRLRNQLIPTSFAGVDAAVLVTGVTARDVDYVDQVTRAFPFVIAFVLALSFVLLTFAFRSIVVPAKAVAINLLSTCAAYGLIVLVFQKGVGADLLGFQQVERVEAWVPLFLFAILFGLSMDYHVFLLSRIRERFNETGDNSEAVTEGIASTARIITGAALIMVAVFTGFALGDLVPFQQLGFGMAVALALDATVVRSVLVPAGMHLLGVRNWYLPRWLRWLPELSVEEPAQQRPAVPPRPEQA